MAECLAIGVNTVICAVVFAPWVLPRETVSGLLGRWAETERGWKRALARPAARLVDFACSWDPDHCAHTYDCERRMRLMRHRKDGGSDAA